MAVLSALLGYRPSLHKNLLRTLRLELTQERLVLAAVGPARLPELGIRFGSSGYRGSISNRVVAGCVPGGIVSSGGAPFYRLFPLLLALRGLLRKLTPPLQPHVV